MTACNASLHIKNLHDNSTKNLKLVSDILIVIYTIHSWEILKLHKNCAITLSGNLNTGPTSFKNFEFKNIYQMKDQYFGQCIEGANLDRRVFVSW